MGTQWKQWQTLFSWAPKITADSNCSHEIKRCLLLGRKAMTNLDSILKSRDITLLTKWKWSASVMSTLCDPMDWSPPGSSVHGIFQARMLEWVAISFSGRSSRPRDWTWVSCIAGRLFTVWATKRIHRVKAMVFPVVMYGCESWTIKKTEHQRIDAFELGDSLASLGLHENQTSQS